MTTFSFGVFIVSPYTSLSKNANLRCKNLELFVTHSLYNEKILQLTLVISNSLPYTLLPLSMVGICLQFIWTQLQCSTLQPNIFKSITYYIQKAKNL